ncbi:minor capsid protein [Streptococcus minor]|uniref:minor capsid protein n=1 Tax=Streptococcus minor TaxID=229549 RepID=UPI0021AB83EC|nr:minor capsid protein [Streptococcus minor]
MTDKRIINNQRYNAERKAQAELMKRDLDRDKMLAQLYQESYDRMQEQIDQFYMAYAGKEGLTKQEAMKRVSEMDVTKFNDKASKAVREKDFSHGTNSWLREYNLKMKVSRLELLKSELALEIQNLTAETNEIFDKARYDELTNEFKRQSGILGNSATKAPKRLEAILDADFYGQKFSNRVWGNLGLQATLQRDVFGSLNRIYTDMMGYKQERNRLAKKFGTSKANAQRLLKTEIARINADTQYQMLKENGFTHMIFVAEPGACDICGPLDQKAIPIEDVEKGLNMFPMHPNCRCSAYGHIKMDYKVGGSTLDEYEVWELKETPEEEYNVGIFKADLNYIRQSAYVEKFKNNELTAPIAEQLASVSRKIIQHRAGTPFEDYYLLDVNTGKVVAVSNKARKTKGVVYNDHVRNAFKSSSEKGLVSIHNHPSGYPPSLSDLASLQQRSKNNSVKYGLTAGHDGSVYWYSRPNKRIPRSAQEKYVNQIEKFKKLGYNESVAQEKTLEMFSEVFEFEFGRIE